MNCLQSPVSTMLGRTLSIKSSTHRHDHFVQISHDVIIHLFGFDHDDLAPLSRERSLNVLEPESGKSVTVLNDHYLYIGVRKQTGQAFTMTIHT